LCDFKELLNADKPECTFKLKASKSGLSQCSVDKSMFIGLTVCNHGSKII